MKNLIRLSFVYSKRISFFTALLRNFTVAQHDFFNSHPKKEQVMDLQTKVMCITGFWFVATAVFAMYGVSVFGKNK